MVEGVNLSIDFGSYFFYTKSIDRFGDDRINWIVPNLS